MFGYLKFNTRQVRRVSRSTYKYYYCGLCNALKKNYGVISTLYLSNDAAFIAIMAAIKHEPNKLVCPRCSLLRSNRKISTCYLNADWRGLATFTLGLVYAKTIDNDLDESSIVARTKSKIVRSMLKRAYKQNKLLFDELNKQILDIKKNESNNCNIVKQSQLFAEFIKNALNMCLSTEINLESMNMIIPTMKWLCYIDAVDDFNEDRRKRHYNPLQYSVINPDMGYSPSYGEWKEFFASNWKQLTSLYSSVFQELMCASNRIGNGKSAEKDIVDIMLHEQMPQKLLSIMKENT